MRHQIVPEPWWYSGLFRLFPKPVNTFGERGRLWPAETATHSMPVAAPCRVWYEAAARCQPAHYRKTIQNAASAQRRCVGRPMRYSRHGTPRHPFHAAVRRRAAFLDAGVALPATDVQACWLPRCVPEHRLRTCCLSCYRSSQFSVRRGAALRRHCGLIPAALMTLAH